VDPRPSSSGRHRSSRHRQVVACLCSRSQSLP
jgi:hypothetical protein